MVIKRKDYFGKELADYYFILVFYE